jgi:ribosomal protein S27AE
MAVARWRSRGCGAQATLQQLHWRGGGGVLMAEHSTAQWRRWGCGGCPTDAEPRRSPPEQASTGRSSSKLTRADRATRARSIVAELGGDVGDGRRCRWIPAVRRWGATSRSGSARERRWISPELAGAGRGMRRRRESPEEIGLGFRPRARESEGWAAEPGRAGSVKPLWWTDRWARAVSPFLFLI